MNQQQGHTTHTPTKKDTALRKNVAASSHHRIIAKTHVSEKEWYWHHHKQHNSPIFYIYYKRNYTEETYHTPFPSNIPYIPILQNKLLQQHHIPTPISPPPKQNNKKKNNNYKWNAHLVHIFFPLRKKHFYQKDHVHPPMDRSKMVLSMKWRNKTSKLSRHHQHHQQQQM